MYTIYATRALAIATNATEAEVRGCNMTSTIEWWPRINHPTDGRAALNDGTGPYTQAQLEAEGWFQQIEE